MLAQDPENDTFRCIRSMTRDLSFFLGDVSNHRNEKQTAIMPEISRFLGILVYRYYRNHMPPHFHAEYGEFEITVEIESGVVSGRFPRRALVLVLEWSILRRAELLADWELAANRLPLKPIPPLE